VRASASAFSLVELVIVVVIVGVIAAIAVPRLTSGVSRAESAAVKANRVVLQKAIEHYAAEHRGAYPDGLLIAQQLTQYTDEDGEVLADADATHIYGPYVRKIPAVKVRGHSWDQIATASANDVGWIYRPTTGNIYPNIFQTTAMLTDQFLTTVLTPQEKDYFMQDGELPP